MHGWHSPSCALRIRMSSMDPGTEEGLLPEGTARHAGHDDLSRLVGEDLQGDRRG
jgi:hypothetical protein